MKFVSVTRLDREKARREWLAAAEILACSSDRLRLARLRRGAPISEGFGGRAIRAEPSPDPTFAEGALP
jgi:hypothetical protein